MENTNWLKQAPNKPLFPDLLWSRPENKRQAGKLLIVGGNSHGFAAPATAFGGATAAGVGVVRVLLPDSLRKTIGTSFTEAEFAPRTPSGSFAKKALDSLLDGAKWADMVLLAGDFGRNSETAVLLGSFMDKYSGPVTVAEDGLDYFLAANGTLLNRQDTLSVINLGKLQKLAKANRPGTPVLHSMNLHELTTILADWTNSTEAAVITKHADNFIVAASGKVSTTPAKEEQNWQIELAAYSAVWWLQNREKSFEALTAAVYEYVNK
jgi:NAD(P)H-hydrate repair Nnr-like enzyme with NAD(P)H-hydrate dehydratase domain